MGEFVVVGLAVFLYAFTVVAVNWLTRRGGTSTALRYTVLLVGTLVSVLALLHLHADMTTTHDHSNRYCWPLWLLVGMGLMSASSVASLLTRQRKIAHSLARWSEHPPEPMKSALTRLTPHFRLSKTPELKLITADAPMALTIGILKPRIYLSTGLIARLSAEELEGVLAHELAHIARADNLIAFVSQALAGAILPLSHSVLRLLLAERELAADTLAISVTGKPITLARTLLKVADGAPINEASVACLLDSALIEQRVHHLIALHHCAPASKSPGLEPKRIAALTIFLPPVLAWFLFVVPHLLHFQ